LEPFEAVAEASKSQVFEATTDESR